MVTSEWLNVGRWNLVALVGALYKNLARVWMSRSHCMQQQMTPMCGHWGGELRGDGSACWQRLACRFLRSSPRGRGCGKSDNVYFWTTVCKTVRPMLSDRCLSLCPVLSVTLVYCGETVWQIKMKLGMQVGLGHGHTVLDGDPAPPHPKGHSPPKNFQPMFIVAKQLDGSRWYLAWR